MNRRRRLAIAVLAGGLSLIAIAHHAANAQARAQRRALELVLHQRQRALEEELARFERSRRPRPADALMGKRPPRAR
jgi:hypothetical protein